MADRKYDDSNGTRKKAFIIGSSQYGDKFKDLRARLEAQGYRVLIPAFDTHPSLTALEICKYNRSLIELADIVYVIWDARSVGTIFDLGMAFALHKPLRIEFIEGKTFDDAIIGYARQTMNRQEECHTCIDGSNCDPADECCTNCSMIYHGRK